MTLRDIATVLGLDQPERRILIVEDFLPLLLRLEEYMRQAGHEVVAVVGVDEISDNIATGRCPNPDQTQTFDLSTFDVAFLDHYFLSARYNGATLTRELLLRGQPRIFCMSSDAMANASMVRNGATLAMRKAEFSRLLSIA